MRQPRSRTIQGSLVLSLAALFLASYVRASGSQAGPQSESRDCDRYLVRRIEFNGNAHTGDRPIRRRIALSEGRSLSERDIEKTIKNLNRWGRLERITREDVIVAFSTDDPETPSWHCFADVRIHVREKR